MSTCNNRLDLQTLGSQPVMLINLHDHWSRDHFGLHQENNVRVAMGLEVPQRPLFRPSLSTVMVQKVLRWERQKRFSHYKCQGTMINIYFILFYLFFLPKLYIVMREEGEKVKHAKNSQNCSF